MSRSRLNPAADPYLSTPLPKVRPLALAVHLIVFGGAFALATHAPEAFAQSTPQATATRSYDIPAGPLSSALVRFAREAGVALVGAGNAAEGKSSPGLKGSHTVQGGFAALLAGSGLEAFRQGDGSYGLRLAPVMDKRGEVTLAPVNVSAQSVRDGTTEGTGSYTTRSVNTATKLPLSLKETPQTMTVVTRQQMDDMSLTSVDDVLRSTSGVAVRRGLLGTSYTSRGFNLQTQYDGIPNATSLGITDAAAPDSAFLDHIEIQQGAAGLMTGAGNPGGTINLVRKRPTETFQAHAEASVGSWNRIRLVGDISTPVVESGAVRARLVAVSDTGDSFVKHVFSDKQGFYGVIEALPSDRTKIGLGIQYQKSEFNEPTGLPAYSDGSRPNLSRSTFFGLPDGKITSESTQTILYLEQKFGAEWMLKANYTHAEENREGTTGFAQGNASNFRIEPDYYNRSTRSDAIDVYASGPLEILGRRHELAFGVNGIKSNYRNRNLWLPSVTVNIYAPNYATLTGLNIPTGSADADETNSLGVWGVARFNLADSLKFIVGTRLSSYDYTNAKGVKTMEENSIITPYAGIIYDLNKQYSVYASYADIFMPQTQMDRSGSILKPIVGANQEIGIKGDFYGGRLNAAAAIFRLEQTNRPVMDTAFGNPNSVCAGWCYTASDKVLSEGFDLSLNGAITDNLNISAGYTYVNSEYASGSNKGKSFITYAPERIFRLATTYKIPGSDWTIGGNLRTQSRTSAGTVEQPGFSLVGLMAKYQVSKQIETSALVDNVFDKDYWYPNTTSANQIGTPRSFSLKLKYHF